MTPICRAFFHFADAHLARILITQERAVGRRVDVKWAGDVFEVVVWAPERRGAQRKAAKVRQGMQGVSE